MMNVFQVGTHTIAPADLIQLLVQYQMVPQLKRELIIDQAIADIPCSADEIADAQQPFFLQQQIRSEQDLQVWMMHFGLDRNNLDSIIARQVKIEKFKQATWGAKLKGHFFNRKGQFDKVVYSLLRVQDAGAAQEFYFRIQSGEQSFADIAQTYSEGAEALTGGLTGPAELGTLPPLLAKLLTGSQPGHLWSPARMGEWYVVVRLEKLIPAELNEALSQRLLNDLFNEWLHEQLQRMIAPEIPNVA